MLHTEIPTVEGQSIVSKFKIEHLLKLGHNRVCREVSSFQRLLKCLLPSLSIISVPYDGDWMGESITNRCHGTSLPISG